MSEPAPVSSSPVTPVLDDLHRWCREAGWKGWDPYDGLNSRIYQTIFPRTWRLTGIAWTQFVKAMPFQVRPMLGIRPGYNPKGLGLFIHGLLRRAGEDPDHPARGEAGELMEHVLELRSPGFDEPCWGYHFDWHSRNFYLPQGSPNVVSTVYIANAFLYGYETFGDERGLEIAQGACRFILDRLLRSEGEKGSFCFSYTTLSPTRIHNVNLLAAALLLKVWRHTGGDELRDAALAAIRYSVDHQAPDGSWPYGDAWKVKWIDSFHTGFNLEALEDAHAAAKEGWIEASILKGYRFYIDRFFRDDGAPAYYHNRLYPIDIHSSAQGLVTLTRLAHRDDRSHAVRERVLRWTLENMRDPEGYFYAQKNPRGVNKIPYIRWAQAWMFYALALLEEENRMASKPAAEMAAAQ